MTVAPSPIDQVTAVGRAVAVTDTPGTDAVTDTGTQAPRSTHNHVGRFTSWFCAGLAKIDGRGNDNRFRAVSANTCGDTGAGAASATQNGPSWKSGKQVSRYQPPPVVGCPGSE
ncbi:hypothetical protein [Actinokineospora inagensis]|uniref:hypothetical protein n=1 Tax=Actinokineospora inagensis TaxID=103730 RepID=UPI0003F9CDC3|nr:hypothetical protein [Actinokineospora inagensis]